MCLAGALRGASDAGAARCAAGERLSAATGQEAASQSFERSGDQGVNHPFMGSSSSGYGRSAGPIMNKERIRGQESIRINCLFGE
jgi:hypothetical protein